MLAKIIISHLLTQLGFFHRQKRLFRSRSKISEATTWGASLAFEKKTFVSWVIETKTVAKVKISSIEGRDPCVLQNLMDIRTGNVYEPKRLQSWKAEMLFLINHFRQNCDLQSLRVNQNLSCIAGMRVKSMISLSGNLSERVSGMRAAKPIMPSYRNALEVAETNFIVPDEGFHMGQVHLSSTRDRAYIATVLRQDITEIGLDVIQGKDGRFYWSLIFGTLRYPAIPRALAFIAPVKLPDRADAAKTCLNQRHLVLQKKFPQTETKNDVSGRLHMDRKEHCEKKGIANQPPRSRLQSWKAELLVLINDCRAENKLPPLRDDKNLSVIAGMTNKSVVFVTENSSEAASEILTVEQRLRRHRYTPRVVETNFMVHERILRIDQVHRSMMRDQSYADNILRQSITDIGLDVTPGKDGKLYWTLIFALFDYPAQYHKVISPS